MTVKEFFEKYPNADEVIKVGDCLYLSHHLGAAKDHAQRYGLKIERIPNPSKGVVADDEVKDPAGKVEAQKTPAPRKRGRKKAE